MISAPPRSSRPPRRPRAGARRRRRDAARRRLLLRPGCQQWLDRPGRARAARRSCVFDTSSPPVSSHTLATAGSTPRSAAVGAGIAGGYATLLFAAARYDLVPPACRPRASLPAIAAVAVALSLSWSSEIVAGLRAHRRDVRARCFAILDDRCNSHGHGLRGARLLRRCGRGRPPPAGTPYSSPRAPSACRSLLVLVLAEGEPARSAECWSSRPLSACSISAPASRNSCALTDSASTVLPARTPAPTSRWRCSRAFVLPRRRRAWDRPSPRGCRRLRRRRRCRLAA